ncbi:MAG: PAS domain S-box protein [Elusimicrobia bacterium]|nr:PAS domain S-box protein [Elusimicrobiota bacterium]
MNRLTSAFLWPLRAVFHRRQAEEHWAETDQNLRSLIEVSPLAIVVLDEKGRVTAWNPAAERIFGWSEQEILGRRLPIIPDGKEAEFQELLGAAMRGLPPKGIELRRQRKDGVLVDVCLWTAVLKDAGKIRSAVGILSDITERKRAEEAMRRSREQMRALAARLESVREEERVRIAREIHDELGQSLTGLKMDLVWLEKRLMKPQENLAERVQGMQRLTDETIQAVRKISSELRPGVLDDLGLWAAIEWQAKDFEKRTGIRCALRSEENIASLSGERSTAVFRIFQEALTNAARHSGATAVNVVLKGENHHVVLDIHDNGKGITETEASAPRSFGLLGMRERAALLGGEVRIQGEPGEGTRVVMRMPVGEGPRGGNGK